VVFLKNQVKVFRAMAKLSQEELAVKAGVSRQTISLIEREKIVPNLGLAFKIAKVLDAKIEEIFFP